MPNSDNLRGKSRCESERFLTICACPGQFTGFIAELLPSSETTNMCSRKFSQCPLCSQIARRSSSGVFTSSKPEETVHERTALSSARYIA